MAMSSPAESKRELAKAKTRRALLKSALHLYSAEGVQGMSMNKVAKGAGIAQPSFYNHFASLDALQNELSQQLKEKYFSPMRMAWVSMLKDYDSLNKQEFNQRCQQCLTMIFDSAFQNIGLFQHLMEDRPRISLVGIEQTANGMSSLITDIQEEWSDIFIQGMELSGRTFELSNLNLCIDMATAQVHELILGCHQQRYSNDQAISMLCNSFNGLFMNLFNNT